MKQEKATLAKLTIISSKVVVQKKLEEILEHYGLKKHWLSKKYSSQNVEVEYKSVPHDWYTQLPEHVNAADVKIKATHARHAQPVYDHIRYLARSIWGVRCGSYNYGTLNNDLDIEIESW